MEIIIRLKDYIAEMDKSDYREFFTNIKEEQTLREFLNENMDAFGICDDELYELCQ